jgi:acyl-CoA reductase-like NAD-dependent aldehyde dehydrogenase
MSTGTRTERRIPPALIDEFMDAYVAWRQECEAVRAAYGRWSTTATSDRAAAFARFGAALRSEARACQVLAARTERVGRAAGAGAALPPVST